MSLLPLSTAWMAVSELAPRPVALYAGVFFLVNATYIALIWELMNGRSGERSRRSGKADKIVSLGSGAALPAQFNLTPQRGHFRPSFWMDLVALHAAGPFIAGLRVPRKSQVRPSG